MFRLIVYIFGLSVICHCQSKWIIVNDDDLSYRLPNNSIPIRYDLELTTHVHDDLNPEQFKFEGKVVINIEVVEENTKTITLNYRQIEVEHIMLTFGLETIIDDNLSCTRDPDREFLIVNAPEILKKGIYNLKITYSGELRTDNAGFYRSSYIDNDDKTRWLASTQFSSTDARHAFPSYDEPGIRAPIGLKLTYGTRMRAISNMLPESIEDHANGYSTAKFGDTPKMQTYLLAIVVCDFTEVKLTSSNIQQSIYARYNAIENNEGSFGLFAGDEILKVLERYLGIPYDLPKMDQVAIPDFAAGAMENWGLVTYKEENILYNENLNPLKVKKFVATTIGHEFGHQYFGNLVSPAWWSFLWLKEGFARFFEYYASNAAFPDMQIIETVTVQQNHNAFILDALESTRPMSYYVEKQQAIVNLFDDIAYDKSGAVLRMFQHAFTDDAFRLGLRYYLEERKFNFGTPEQLSDALQKAVDEVKPLQDGLNVLDIISSWSEQKGFPVLHVNRLDDGKIVLVQERYLLKSIETPPKTKWLLPYNLATANNPDFTSTAPDGWMSKETDTIKPTAQTNWTNVDWVIFNKQQTGYYRVNYANDLWYLIIDELWGDKYDVINNMNRAQLIDDSLNLARSSRIKYDIAMNLLQYLKKERNYVPWAAADTNLGYLKRILSGSHRYDLLQSYILELVEPVFFSYGCIGNSGERLFDHLTRGIAINWACQMGLESCIKQTSELFSEIIKDDSKDLEPNVKEHIYCNGLRSVGEEEFYYIWKKMQKSKDQSDRILMIISLGCSQEPELLKKYLETTVSDEPNIVYRGQERNRVFSSVYSNGIIGMDISLDFFDQNMDKINDLYNEGVFGGRAIGKAIFGMAKYIVTEEQNSKFEALFVKLTTANYVNEQEVSRAQDQSSENMEWLKNHGAFIEEWLEHYYGIVTTTPFVSTTKDGGAGTIALSGFLLIFGFVLNMYS